MAELTERMATIEHSPLQNIREFIATWVGDILR